MPGQLQRNRATMVLQGQSHRRPWLFRVRLWRAPKWRLYRFASIVLRCIVHDGTEQQYTFVHETVLRRPDDSRPCAGRQDDQQFVLRAGNMRRNRRRTRRRRHAERRCEQWLRDVLLPRVRTAPPRTSALIRAVQKSYAKLSWNFAFGEMSF